MTARAERTARHATRCTFQPKNGYSSVGCLEPAVWTQAPGPAGYTFYVERRCERHFKVDARTYAARGWGWDPAEKYVPFDRQAEYDRVLAAETEKETAAADSFWAEVEALVKARDRKGLQEHLQHPVNRAY